MAPPLTPTPVTPDTFQASRLRYRGRWRVFCFYCGLIKPSEPESAAALSYNNLYILSHDRRSLSAIFMLCFIYLLEPPERPPGASLGVPVCLHVPIPCKRNPVCVLQASMWSGKITLPVYHSRIREDAASQRGLLCMQSKKL